MLRIGSFRSKPRGQTVCPDCGKTFNNAAIPVVCNCGYQFPNSNCDISDNNKKPTTDAKIIYGGLVSVRKYPQGANLRIFVDITENKVCWYQVLQLVYVIWS